MSGQSGAVEPAGLLDRRYRSALALVAVLVLLNQALVQPPLLRLLTDAPVINLAGRQRMLSQKLSKAALALEAVDREPERARWRTELAGVLGDWTAAHHRLRSGNSPELNAAFDDLEPFFQRMRAAAARLLRDDGVAAAGVPLAVILEAESEFLTRMERIVGLFEREAQARIDRLILTGWGVTALVLVGLLAIGGFILHPASRIIEAQLVALRESRDVLEDRVRERTSELERVNRDLALEAEEHSRAEERHRALLEQFSHVARTTTIGAMAGALAHEVNQPLGAIANYTEGCLVALASPQPAIVEIRGTLEKVLATTLRAGAIVKSIRRFVTRHEPVREQCEPNRLVGDVAVLFGDDARRRGINLRLNLAPELPNIEGDPIQIQQVLVNLTRNAIDALGASQPYDPTVIMWTGRSGSGSVEFGVSDNGEGIPEDRLARIFDAYFSTRDDGMGMGLAISRTIVEAHQGRIRVESQPGVGTTFRFTLPA
jgi:signal transduction histidine kinase